MPPKKNWLITEDKSLYEAWLNTTQDAVVGTSQNVETFWEHIHKYFVGLIEVINNKNKTKRGFSPIVVCSAFSIECCWGHILKFVNKYIGFYAQAEACLKSGNNDILIPAKAKELFKANCPMASNLQHCYVILKDSPKFQATQEEVDTRGTKSQAPKVIPNTPSNCATQSSIPSVIDVEDEEPCKQSVLGSDQMECQEAAKKKRTDEESMGRIVHLQKELLQVSCGRLDTVKMAVCDAADKVILSKDLNSMDDCKCAYYKKKLKALYD
ncbi:hypothetical protein PSTG_00667 [Puccinia striiformis f. sp. tritici PST-78]|uniref:No apical meristem-associated C-terminal domain-containing protein n=1 Tax=Puccinia striiformis f. sp. tritici PST-78 TaxID=1165861 RepID=A0A0L0W3T4_9BASI|nr:hypothetical protein PSTG_00667 [Puccinia striiformis f. sp. tritici PST-78]